MSRRVAVIIMAILTLLLGVIAVFIGLRLQQPDSGFVSGELGNPCVNNPSGVCSNSCAPGNLQPSGSCQPGLFCCTPTSTQCRPNQATCGGSNGTCCEGFVCQGATGDQRCQPESGCVGDNCTCEETGGICNGQTVISFVCNQLDSGQCHNSPETHTGPNAFQDGMDRVNNAGQCGQVDVVWNGGSCNRELCGGFTIVDEGCDSPTTTGSTATTTTTATSTPTSTATTTTATSTPTSTATTTTATSTPTSTATTTATSTPTSTATSTLTSTATSTPTSQPTTTSSGGVIGTTSSGGGTLPATALISDDVDRVLIAAVILVLGYLMLRFEIIDNLFLQVGDKVGIRRTRKLVVKNDRNED